MAGKALCESSSQLTESDLSNSMTVKRPETYKQTNKKQITALKDVSPSRVTNAPKGLDAHSVTQVTFLVFFFFLSASFGR